jgi:hypothetical protein
MGWQRFRVNQRPGDTQPSSLCIPNWKRFQLRACAPVCMAFDMRGARRDDAPQCSGGESF